MNLNDVLREIKPADRASGQAALEKWDGLAKPLGSLGVLEEDIVRIAALTGKTDVFLENRVLFVACADNGVVSRKISQSDEKVTYAVAAALGQGSSTVSYMASAARCRVIPVDVGMAEETPPGVLARKIRNSTEDISTAPAMTEKECEQAVLLGVGMAGEQAAAGADILLAGEMGIGNTTTSAAVASALLGYAPEILAGRGAGLSDAGLARKIRVIEEAVALHRPDPSDPMEILRKLGGLDIAFLCGLCLGGALYRIPVLLDGMITNTAALCAVRMCPDVRDALIASHVSREPAAGYLLDAIGIRPCICADLHLGEGSGAVLALMVLDGALTVYQSGHTFGALGIEAYKHEG